MLFRKKDTFRAIKLYSIGSEQGFIDRPSLVEAILKTFETEFDELPKEYGINGPYGIRKGGSVGIEVFKNKLETKGHDKYYGLNGSTEGRFGFHILFDANLAEATYSELIVWYKIDEIELPFDDTVKN